MPPIADAKIVGLGATEDEFRAEMRNMIAIVEALEAAQPVPATSAQVAAGDPSLTLYVTPATLQTALSLDQGTF
jgi:hypothetical protein